jgi:hypothetical protein
MMASRHLDRTVYRSRILAWLMGVPAIAGAVAMVGIEAGRMYHPGAPLFSAPVPQSLADAIERGNVQRAYELIRGGQDPNDRIVVRHSILSGGQSVQVSPLLWAVALQETRAVLMLLAFGARAERTADRRAACLADTLGNAELASLLRRYATDAGSAQCPAPSGERPLVWVVKPE